MAALRAPLAFILLASIALAGCSGGGGAKDGSSPTSAAGDDGGSAGSGAPSLDVGDHWSFKAAGGGGEVTTQTEVKAKEDHGGTPAYRIEGTITSSQLGASTTSSTVAWNRRSDMASLENRVTTQITYAGSTQEQTAVTTFDPPCRNIQWPLSVGKTWTETCHQSTTGNGNTQTKDTTTTYTVEATQEVTVPAGTFDTFRVKAESGGQTTLQYISVKACGLVKSTSEAYGNTVSLELQDYGC